MLATALLTGALMLTDSTPALADHDSPNGTEWPCTSGTGVCGGATTAHHEEMPDIAVVDPSDVCVVQGGVLADPIYGGPQHNPRIPLVNDDPVHGHDVLVGENSINCLFAGELTVESDGGNDGHMIDLFDPVFPIGGPNGDVMEFDPVTSSARQHEFDDHHGSVNESGWSHSSLYSGGPGGGESNACFNNVDNQNKADITAVTGAGTSLGWLKYIRVGVVVDVWGCFYAGPLRSVRFSGSLVWLFNPANPGAAFDVFGVAALGSGWLIDT